MSAKNSSDYYAGRPTKYKPEYDEELIEHMREGGSAVGFAAKHEVPERAFYRWVDANPTFRQAYILGKGLVRDYMFQKLQEHMVEHKDAPKLNCTIFNKLMKAHFGSDQTAQTYLNKGDQVDLSADLTITQRLRNVNEAINNKVLSLEEGRLLLDNLNKESEIMYNEQTERKLDEAEQAQQNQLNVKLEGKLKVSEE